MGFYLKNTNNYKDANKKTNIVVSKYCQKQAEGIKQELPLFQKADHSQHNQGQQGEGVHPHNVPLIA